MRTPLSRRQFVASTAAATGALGTLYTTVPRQVAGKGPQSTDDGISIPYGVQSGDVRNGRAIVWSRADRDGRLFVDVATNDDFDGADTVRGPPALASTDYTATVDLGGLPAGERVYYRAYFEDLREDGESDPVIGSFVTPPETQSDIRFLWSGDVCGQGWGINPDFGGLKIFEAMTAAQPDFFVHSGDAVYADGPIESEVSLGGGKTWENLTTESKTDVADTLDEFRGNYRYNLQDDAYKAFNAQVAALPQWDDHEVTNNWYPGEVLPTDDPHDTKEVDLLAARGQRAFTEYMPIRTGPTSRDQVYNNFPYGPSLEVFRLDLRSYRGPNTDNTQSEEGPETPILGAEQLAWLKQALHDSTATWKVIASDMPIGLVVPDDDAFEAIANDRGGDPLGRELEIADLLSFMKTEGIENTVWLTADVHYTAAHRYDPRDAPSFTDFDPFWEFVSGPLNSGTFGPNELDETFGPTVVYEKAPKEGASNLPPTEGYQFFGQVDIDGETEVMTVTLKDLEGTSLYAKELPPA